ncbi:MAG TPA: hypothetical protein VL500_07840 [Candidatus Eisenbacteria bacterium]|jgi:hypothetical protein|nr:hypothetical protein [Candidatus Eisenbacteria bacterium]
MKIPVTQVTLLRLICLTVGSIAFALVTPVGDDITSGELHLAGALFMAAIISLLVRDAAARRQKLFEAVRVELNKIRRIYHLAKNLAAANQKYRTWFTDMHGYVYEYLSSFAGKDFDSYDGFNASFRKLSYHIYTVPDLETKKDEALFQDLLRTASTVAESRQQIKELWDSRLSAYGWTVVLLMTLAFVVTTTMAMSETYASRLSAGLLIATALLAVDLLWETDTLAGEKKDMATRYVDNIGRLELGRRD